MTDAVHLLSARPVLGASMLLDVGKRGQPIARTLVLSDGTRHAAIDLRERPDQTRTQSRGAAHARTLWWLARPDAVLVFADAMPALRACAHADIHIGRPVCARTIAQILGDRPERVVPATDRDGAVQAARGALAAFGKLLPRVTAEQQQDVARLESAVLLPFASMMDTGMAFDADGWRDALAADAAHMKAASDEVFRALGDAVPRDLFGTPELNLDADAEVKAALERVLGAPLAELNRRSLAVLDHPAARALLTYREHKKRVSTWGADFLEHVAPDGRLRGLFAPIGTSTGRVASHSPNMQNLPGDARFHACTKAPAGRALITADYAGAELRVLAALSGAPAFLDAFARDADLHSEVASDLFGVPVSKTENAALRGRAKAINFGLLYGMGARALAAQLDLNVPEAEALLERYFETFPGIRDFMQAEVERAMKRGYGETALGRRMRFDAETLKTAAGRRSLSRIARNMPIQGTSADIAKLAMVLLHETLRTRYPTARLVNMIHDELVVECDETDAASVGTVVQTAMEDAMRHIVPAVTPKADVHIGAHWTH